MEAWTSANSVFHMEWQWMKQVTLALSLTWGAIRSEEWHSRADEHVVEVHAHFFCCNHLYSSSLIQYISCPYLHFSFMREERKKGIRR